MNFRVLDLFCGAGGLSWGVQKNPHFKTVLALDSDEKAADTFKRNMPDTKVMVGDLTLKTVKEKIVTLSKEMNVNMIVGGPPCQGYSMKGKKIGLADPRNFLFREFLAIVNEIKPEVFLIENVKGLLYSSNGWFRKEILDSIQKLNYYVDCRILNAVDFGVPQSRERTFFLCSKSRLITLPQKNTEERITVKDAIGDLSFLNSGEGAFQQEYRFEASSNYQIMMRKDCSILYNHKASKHKDIAIKKLMLIPPEKDKSYLPVEMRGKQQFKTTWGRLKWDDVSPTIDTRFDAASNGTNNHPYLHRAITAREAARLQSFDDKFVFWGNKVYIRKQIGNAVPPLLAKAIADQIDAYFR